MRILVIAEQENGQLVDATLSAVAAAQKLAEGQDGATIDLLAAGFNCSEFATQCTMVSQVAQVIHVDAPQFEANLAENMSALVVSLVQQQGYQAVICANTSFGKNVSPGLRHCWMLRRFLMLLQLMGLAAMSDPYMLVTSC